MSTIGAISKGSSQACSSMKYKQFIEQRTDKFGGMVGDMVLLRLMNKKGVKPPVLVFGTEQV